MRFHKLVWVALGAAVLIVAAVCALLFFTGDDLALLNGETAKYKVWLTSDAGQRDAKEADTQTAPQKTALAKRAVVTRNYCLIGDSRTVGLDRTCGLSQSAQFAVIAEVGQGYYWMQGTALWEAAATGFDEYVILLGINDLENVELYLSAYRNLIEEGVHLTLATVGPVEEGKGDYQITNYQIDKFNERLYEVENATVIDLNAYLWKNDFSTLDGVHYTDETHRLIEEFLMIELI